VWCTAAAVQPSPQCNPQLATHRAAVLLATIAAVKGHEIAAQTF